MASRQKFLKTLFFVGGLLLGGGLFAFLVWKTGPEDVWRSLLAFGVFPVLGFVSISLLNFCLYTLRWKLILDAMVSREYRVPFHKMFMNRMSGFAAGYITPAAQVASEPIRVAMLRGDGVPLREATGSVVLDLAFEITAFVLYVAIGLGFAFTQGLGGDGNLTWPILFIAVLLGILVLFFVTTARGQGFFYRFISVFGLNRWKPIAELEEWLVETEGLMSKFLVKKGWLIVFVVMLSLTMAAFKAVEAIYLSHFLGVDIQVTDAFLMSTLPGIALLLPVPAGLGVFEGSNAAMFALLGVNLNAIAYTLIIRVRDFLFIAAGVIYAVYSGEKLIAPYADRS